MFHLKSKRNSVFTSFNYLVQKKRNHQLKVQNLLLRRLIQHQMKNLQCFDQAEVLLQICPQLTVVGYSAQTS